jgi:hypothetical protein
MDASAVWFEIQPPAMSFFGYKNCPFSVIEHSQNYKLTPLRRKMRFRLFTLESEGGAAVFQCQVEKQQKKSLPLFCLETKTF